MEVADKNDNQDQAAREIAETIGDLLVSREMTARSEYLWFLAASWLFVLGLLAVLLYLLFEAWWHHVFQVLTDKNKVCGLLQKMGAWGPPIFILAQAFEVLLPYWPLPLEIAGGFLFGLPLGIFYSTIGLGLGSMTAFALGRWLERYWLSQVVPPQKLKRFRMLMKRQGTLTAFIIFPIPWVPKDIFCYLMGLTRMSLHYYLVAVTIARLPSTLILALQGSQAQKGHYYLTLVLVIFSLGMATLLYNRRETLYHWTVRWHLEEE